MQSHSQTSSSQEASNFLRESRCVGGIEKNKWDKLRRSTHTKECTCECFCCVLCFLGEELRTFHFGNLMVSVNECYDWCCSSVWLESRGLWFKPRIGRGRYDLIGFLVSEGTIRAARQIYSSCKPLSSKLETSTYVNGQF